VLGKVHQDFAGKLETARLWGAAVYGGQVRYAFKKNYEYDLVFEQNS